MSNTTTTPPTESNAATTKKPSWSLFQKSWGWRQIVLGVLIIIAVRAVFAML